MLVGSCNVPCYHSNETSLAELLHRTIYFLGFYETKFRIFGEFFAFGHFRSERVRTYASPLL